MQLYALNNTGSLIFVDRAIRHEDYLCMECGGIVRVRGGVRRRSHFFHKAQDVPCRQSKKSIEHIQVQCYLQKNLVGTVFLEHRFKERIADVVWENEKIIFEVQCSPIKAEEVEARNRQYAQYGYQVIWVLHETTFNQKRLSAAEHFLRDHPHYFTNINALGEGCIYDQYSEVRQGRRKNKGELLPLELKLRKKEYFKAPSFLKKRLAKWSCYLEGDLLHQAKQGLLEYEEQKKQPQSFFLKRWYRNIFQILLENACR